MERIGEERALGLIHAHNKKEMHWAHPGRRLGYRQKMEGSGQEQDEDRS